MKEENELKELLANIEHDRWSRWMQYLFSVSAEQDDGSAVIPRDKVDRWKHQIHTKYENLSELEKDSDRKEADITILTLKEFFKNK